jgi:hypothetical protein
MGSGGKSKTGTWPVPVDVPSAIIGVWTPASRAKSLSLSPGKREASGEIVQVSRLGIRWSTRW